MGFGKLVDPRFHVMVVVVVVHGRVIDLDMFGVSTFESTLCTRAKFVFRDVRSK